MEIDNLPNLQSFVIDDYLPSSLQEPIVGSLGGIMWNIEPTWKHRHVVILYTRRVMEFEQLFIRNKLSIWSLKLQYSINSIYN